MHFLKVLFLILLISAGCGRPRLALQQQQITPAYLASTNVGTPDPRTPPKGQMIVAEWFVPRWVVNESPILSIDILFENLTEDRVEFPITSTVGYETYSVLNKQFKETGGLLAYKAEITNTEGEILAEWKHQLWVKLITVDAE